MTKTKKLNELKALHTSGTHAGDIVWWSLSDALIKAPAFRDAWARAGLDATAGADKDGKPRTFLPEDPSPARALRNACALVLRGVGDHIFQPADKDDTMAAVYAVMQVRRPAPGVVEDVQCARVAVDKAGGFLTDDPASAVVQAVRAKYDEIFGHFQAREIRESITALLLNGLEAVPIRASGGVYWVPPVGAEVVRKLEECIKAIGGSDFVTLAQYHSDANDAALGAAAHGSIEVELTKLEEEMNGFAARAAGTAQGPALQAYTLENRLEEFDRLRSRAELYRTVLAVKVDDLDGKLAALEAQAKEILGLVMAAKTPAAA